MTSIPRLDPSNMSALLLLIVLSGPILSVLSLSPPEAYEHSKALTKDLLSLNLGYNVLSNKAMRDVMGMDVDRISDGAVEYVDYDADDTLVEERFFDDDVGSDDHDELLPSPLELVRDLDYRSASSDLGSSASAGPNPVSFWLDSDFWRGSSSSPSPSSGPPSSWGPFGGRPVRRPRPAKRPSPSSSSSFGPFVGHASSNSPPRRSRPKKKLFVGDQHQCTSGSCEFFVFCWISGGTMSGGCGGFLFTCCQRPQAVGTHTILARVSPKKLSNRSKVLIAFPFKGESFVREEEKLQSLLQSRLKCMTKKVSFLFLSSSHA